MKSSTEKFRPLFVVILNGVLMTLEMRLRSDDDRWSMYPPGWPMLVLPIPIALRRCI